METTDLTTRILIEIRDGIHRTNERVDQLGVRVDKIGEHVEQLGERVDQLGERVDQLGDRVERSELRTANAIHDLHGTMREIFAYLKERGDLRPRVERCERDIEELKQRTA